MKEFRFEDYAHNYDYLTMERQDGILELRIHGPKDPGAPVVWDFGVHQEMSFAFTDIARDRENQCVIITGTAGEFIGSIGDFGDSADPLSWDVIFEDGRRLIMELLNIEVPVIGAINGPALVHAELGVLSDIVIASETATFQDAPHVPNGLVPGDGVQVIWPLILGPNRGRYFLLTGQTISAQEALTLGIVSEVLPPDRLMDRARELAREILRRPVLVRRYARVAMTQHLKKLFLDNLGYGLALEGLSAAVSLGMPKNPA
jgi:enoyl-CoA hydratase/carnithine racemase